MICPNCGENLKEGAKFCTKCGVRVDDSTIDGNKEPVSVNDSAESYILENGNVTATSGTSLKKTFVWKEKYTYTAITSAIMIAAVVGLVIRAARNEDVNLIVNEAKYNREDEIISSQENILKEKENEDNQEIALGDEKDSPDESDEGYGESVETNNQCINTEDIVAEGAMSESVNDTAMDNEVLNSFGINSATIEDYSANLDPNRYLFYDSGMGEFYFYYPAYLFNNVSVDDSAFSTEYGINVKNICFYGSGGTELYYTMYERNDGLSIPEITDSINQNEHEKYYDMSDILVRADDEKGRIVLSGVMDSDQRYRVYDMIKINSDYVYRMLSVKPKYRTEEERIQYAYVTENEYRMCGFSGSSQTARSYEEFLESNP